MQPPVAAALGSGPGACAGRRGGHSARPPASPGGAGWEGAGASLTCPRAVPQRRLASPSGRPAHAEGRGARLGGCSSGCGRGSGAAPQPLPALRWHEPSAAARRLRSFVCCSGCVRAAGWLSYGDAAGPCPGASPALGSARSAPLRSSRAAPERTEDRALLGLLRPGAAMLCSAWSCWMVAPVE